MISVEKFDEAEIISIASSQSNSYNRMVHQFVPFFIRVNLISDIRIILNSFNTLVNLGIMKMSELSLKRNFKTTVSPLKRIISVSRWMISRLMVWPCIKQRKPWKPISWRWRRSLLFSYTLSVLRTLITSCWTRINCLLIIWN